MIQENPIAKWKSELETKQKVKAQIVNSKRYHLVPLIMNLVVPALSITYETTF